MLSAGGSGVPHRRRIVICLCGKCQAGARSGFRPGCGQPLGACRDQPREQKRRAKVGPTMVARRVWVTGVTAETVCLALVLVVRPRLT